MAFDYDTANTGVFTRIGKIVKYVNAHQTMAGTTLPAELKAIADPFEAADMTDQIDTLYDDFAGWQEDQVRLRQTLADYASNVLSDRVSVLEQLGITSANGLDATFWETLHYRMNADTETIDASYVSFGSTTAAGANHGNGTVLLTTTLDAVNAPLADGPALLSYAGIESELAVTETMTFECVADALSGSASGSEQLSWRGGIANPPFDYHSEGSGEGPTLTACGAGGILTDGEFENWTTNTPDNWTIATGTAGTHIFHETSNYYRSGDSLKFLGTGVQASMSVTQTLTDTIEPGRTYNLNLRLKCSTNAPAAGNFAAQVAVTYQDGTSATQGITVAAAALTNAWTLKNAFVIFARQDITSAVLTISWTNTPTNAVSLYVDCVALQPVVYHGGLGAVVVPGSTDFWRGDKFTVAVTNDGAGTFQTFFRRKYRVQLPSDDGGTETIADSLAE